MSVSESKEGNLTVGVTGHRWNKLPPHAHPRITAWFGEAFAVIASVAGDGVTLVSGFAEGADQLAVHAAPPGWRVEALLPTPLHAFARDFSSERATGGVDRSGELSAALVRADAVHERAGGPNAYAEQGKALVARCDLLLAVWDGGPAAGAGGTAEVVEAATRAGRPVAIIAPDGARRLLPGAVLSNPTERVAQVLMRLQSPPEARSSCLSNSRIN